MAQVRRAIYSLVVHNQQAPATCGLSGFLSRSTHGGAFLRHQKGTNRICSQQPATTAETLKYSQSTRSLSAKIQTEVSISDLIKYLLGNFKLN